ncbi:MAG TPA: hypothetical protein DDW49_09000 [Deltaproteobacteria bacterium]|nr:MAG: hypothetical protein A2048_00995 [Deltaproteobacteria bacterium GWA2_45_12]HBF13497.1 hypothetical protein [Deltaproteobacteria bacterium]
MGIENTSNRNETFNVDYKQADSIDLQGKTREELRAAKREALNDKKDLQKYKRDLERLEHNSEIERKIDEIEKIIAADEAFLEDLNAAIDGLRNDSENLGVDTSTAESTPEAPRTDYKDGSTASINTMGDQNIQLRPFATNPLLTEKSDTDYLKERGILDENGHLMPGKTVKDYENALETRRSDEQTQLQMINIAFPPKKYTAEELTLENAEAAVNGDRHYIEMSLASYDAATGAVTFRFENIESGEVCFKTFDNLKYASILVDTNAVKINNNPGDPEEVWKKVSAGGKPVIETASTLTSDQKHGLYAGFDTATSDASFEEALKLGINGGQDTSDATKAKLKDIRNQAVALMIDFANGDIPGITNLVDLWNKKIKPLMEEAGLNAYDQGQFVIVLFYSIFFNSPSYAPKLNELASIFETILTEIPAKEADINANGYPLLFENSPEIKTALLFMKTGLGQTDSDFAYLFGQSMKAKADAQGTEYVMGQWENHETNLLAINAYLKIKKEKFLEQPSANMQDALTIETAMINGGGDIGLAGDEKQYAHDALSSQLDYAHGELNDLMRQILEPLLKKILEGNLTASEITKLITEDLKKVPDLTTVKDRRDKGREVDCSVNGVRRAAAGILLKALYGTKPQFLNALLRIPSFVRDIQVILRTVEPYDNDLPFEQTLGGKVAPEMINIIQALVLENKLIEDSQRRARTALDQEAMDKEREEAARRSQENMGGSQTPPPEEAPPPEPRGAEAIEGAEDEREAEGP